MNGAKWCEREETASITGNYLTGCLYMLHCQPCRTGKRAARWPRQPDSATTIRNQLLEWERYLKWRKEKVNFDSEDLSVRVRFSTHPTEKIDGCGDLSNISSACIWSHRTKKLSADSERRNEKTRALSTRDSSRYNCRARQI